MKRAFGGAVRPQRVLRRERQVLRGDGLPRPVRVEPRLTERSRRLPGSGAGSRAPEEHRRRRSNRLASHTAYDEIGRFDVPGYVAKFSLTRSGTAPADQRSRPGEGVPAGVSPAASRVATQRMPRAVRSARTRSSSPCAAPSVFGRVHARAAEAAGERRGARPTWRRTRSSGTCCAGRSPRGSGRRGPSRTRPARRPRSPSTRTRITVRSASPSSKVHFGNSSAAVTSRGRTFCPADVDRLEREEARVLEHPHQLGVARASAGSSPS